MDCKFVRNIRIVPRKHYECQYCGGHLSTIFGICGFCTEIGWLKRYQYRPPAPSKDPYNSYFKTT